MRWPFHKKDNSLNQPAKPPADSDKQDQLPDLTELEQRVMYSASPIGDIVVDDLPAEELNEIADVDETTDSVANRIDETSDLAERLLVDLEQSFNNDSGGVELVIIDSAVDDYELLIEDIASQDDRNYEIFLLDSQRDGIEQISTIINSHQGVEAVHLISHGEDGVIQLGNTRLSNENLAEYQDEIDSWSAHLTEDSDLFIYGCNLAETGEGQELIDSISKLTGADVAASDDLTGHEDLGGDWEFEYIVGVVETDLAFSVDALQNWEGTLASVTVTTLDDVVDRTATSVANLVNNPGADGVISLREAIIASNANADADVIFLGAGVHTLSLTGSGEEGGDLDINRDVQIIGLANGSTVIDASGLTDPNTMIGERVFEVANNDATFQYLTITGGNDGTTDGGGGIRVRGSSAVIVDNVVVTGNHSAGSGGGITNAGTLTVTNSTFSFNTTERDGGGISSNDGQIVLNNVTLSGNEAVDEGGGVFIVNGSSHDLTNVTVSGNEANDGGGFAVAGLGTGVDLTNVTIANNTANNDGGGIYNGFGQANIDVTATIVSGNTATNNDANVRSTHIDEMGSNSIGDDPNLMLGDLADNGGPVQTHALLPGSNAINGMGSQAGTDARGFLLNDERDIGAFEFGATPASQLAGLLFSTASDVTGSAAPGLNDWDNLDVIRIGDPNLAIENGNGSPGMSNGTFSEAIDFLAFADPATPLTTSIDALHLVGTHLTFLGVDLQPGDVLFSTTAETTFDSNNLVTLSPANVHLFRPDTPGDYSAGTFTADVVDFAALNISPIDGFTLVETDTNVGGQALSAGDFLHLGTGPVVNVNWYDASANASSVLVDGADVGINSAITGLELIERAHTSGDITLDAGTLLLHTIAGASSLGSSNSIATEDIDVVALNLSSTGPGQHCWYRRDCV